MSTPITCLGKTFATEDERRSYFRDELRKQLPELRKIEGFPIGTDDDILNLSDPPYYTACPNPWLNDFIAQWEEEKKELEKNNKRKAHFEVHEPYASDVSEGKNSAIYNAHSYHTKVPHAAIMRYILHYTQPGDIIIDAFSGTGMTGVAATLCGKPELDIKLIIESEWETSNAGTPNWGVRNCINNDLSPIASHISAVYNNADIIDDYDEIESVLDILDKEMSYLYETKVNGITKKINYLVWSSVIVCENCGHTTDYFDLAYKHKNLSDFDRLEMVKCPYCEFTRNSRALPIYFTTKFDPISDCTERTAQLNLSLISYFANKTKTLKAADDYDRKLCDDVIKKLKEIEVKIVDNPGGVNLDQALKSHGYKFLYQFYPDRTLLVIDRFLKLTKKIKSKVPLFILTSALPKLTKLNRYMPEHGGRALVGPRANTLYVPPLFVENNAVEQLKYQFEKIKKAIRVKGKQVIQTGSATQLNLSSDSIDYIFTDPPFGGNIMYSELNLLSETWLKVITNNLKEAITNDSQSKSVLDYQELMVNCFKEYYRVLKPGKWITVEFSNTSAAVWNAIQYALKKTGFFIVSVDILNKLRPGFVGMIGPNAVKEDLAITCLKPLKDYERIIKTGNEVDILWEITSEILSNSSVIDIIENKSSNVISRDPRVLWDRVSAFFLVNGFSFPIDLDKFQDGLKQRYIERDGMYFTLEQAHEYDDLRAKLPNYVQLSLLITNESEGIEWLRSELIKPLAAQDIQPKWLKAIAAVRKYDILPDLRDILIENFIQNSDGKWRVPNMNEAKDRETVRKKALHKEFGNYVIEINKPKTKRLKEVRVEALRAGFKSCWEKKEFTTIVNVAEKIPQNLLMEDEQLLMFYDIAKDKV
jgi:DNA modification methylase